MYHKTRSITYFKEALKYIPGGVNSPVRAFNAVGGTPPFIRSAKGSYLYDEDDNIYIDLINSWGPMILGHAHPIITKAVKEAIEDSLSFGAPTIKETELAKLIVSMVPSIEKVRMVNSGTEATMSAVRLARGYTGKDKIIKFQGCYHGHGDVFLIAAGSGAITAGIPDSLGVTEKITQDTLIAEFNNLSSVKKLISENRDEIAAIILEPVAGNMGCVLPEDGFLQGLRKLCDRYSIVLIFDEVMTGFRLRKGGAQVYYNVFPDLTTLGKIIGGGMPVGAYGGKKEIMDFVSPSGPVYQAGTLSGNPIAMSAGYAMLNYLNNHTELYDKLDMKAKEIEEGFENNLINMGFSYTINRIGSMISIFFIDGGVRNFTEAKKSNLKIFKKYFHAMLKRGIYLAPSQFESLFISLSLSKEDIAKIIKANYQALKEIH